jgi:hypothetical protein
MVALVLKVFGGMVPRRGEQHLDQINATDAENTLLYSGELRPLHRPALVHRFPKPGDTKFYAPLEPPSNGPPVIVDPPDPTVPPTPEPPPTTPGTGLGYDCSAYHDAIMSLNPTAYWPCDDAGPPVSIADIAGDSRDLSIYGTQQFPEYPSFLDDCPPAASWFVAAGPAFSPENYSPERVGRQDAALVTDTGGTWWVLAKPTNRMNVTSGIFRVDTGNNSYIRVALQFGGVKAAVINGTFDFFGSYSDFGTPVPVDTSVHHAYGIQWEPAQGRMTVWVDFVKRAVWYMTVTPVYGAAGERVFSFADRGSMTIQHGINFNRILNYEEIDILWSGYNRTFLGYVTP